MREIKFRAWDEGNKVMLHTPLASLYGLHRLFGFIVPKPDTPIMQYTGLKDKNGKEIYEGDVVIESGESKAVVEFDIGCGFTLDIYGGRPWHQLGEIEIIGNVYENPELVPNGK